ncbi:DUF917 domain-containing protein [Parachlamydia sp. AcF125]|uniref:DUF917 domain-containing protein n=1 Tax=Parachlamydia sp. AcF125 TaxID=2795736 RepID=UPI001BCA105A|nr:DUF917 domain-containing protein [Parachlamydia sp. AcF125]MBS4167675.1 hypothetical protein [Parachlamydia sp. AcF125]
MKKLTVDQLDDLAIGSAILGSGGGGDPAYFYMMANYLMEKLGPVSIIKTSELKPDDFILPLGMIGAPLVETEKFPTGREYVSLIRDVETATGRKVTVLMPCEAAGSNAFVPVMIGNQLGLPVLDADLMGRAFPEVQMCSNRLLGLPPAPAFISDCLGNSVIINAQNSLTLEKIARQITISMGSWGLFADRPMTAQEAEKCVIHKSMSRALSIGKAHREAKAKGTDPLEAVLNLCKGLCIGTGKITDIDRTISKGFLKGSVAIQNKNDRLEICFQNEYLLAKCNGKILATTPDIIMLMEQETGEPITSESLRFGLKVDLIVLPSPSIWTTKQGLAVVGPRYFGYETDYLPIQKSRQKVLSLT